MCQYLVQYCMTLCALLIIYVVTIDVELNIVYLTGGILFSCLFSRSANALKSLDLFDMLAKI